MKIVLTIFFLWICNIAIAQSKYKLTIVDLYGNRTISDSIIRNHLPLKEGDSITQNPFAIEKIKKQLQSIPGVAAANMNLICCDSRANGLMLFVGISESANSFVYHVAPDDKERLPEAVKRTAEQIDSASWQAILRRTSEEDTTYAYSLFLDTTVRSLQLKYVDYARQYKDLIKAVLYHSEDARHRAWAAEIVAYDSNKQYVIQHLLYGVYDPNEEVRNNATRALGVLQNWLIRHPDQKLTIPSAPFVQMINSVIWTDRNKGILVLNALTQHHHPALLATLKKECLPSLIEMARWKSDGHAMSAYFILGRIAGYTDQETYEGFTASDRNAFLVLVIKKIKTL